MSNTTSNLAAVLHGAADLRIEEHPISTPASGEVQIAIKSTGLCGSDLHYYIHGRNGEYVLRHPMALGHESSGVVTAVGDDAGSFKVGDRVAVEAGINCAHCRYCQLGRYNLCKNMRFASSAKVYPHQHGTLQTLINHPVRRLHHLADNVSFEEAALAEPLAVALQAASRANISAGQTVLIYGAGAVGLLVAAVARAFGATEIAIVDINADRVNFAVNEGFVNAGHTLPMGPRPTSPEEGLASSKKTAEDVLAATSKQNDDGFDVVLECTGVQTCMQASIHSARPGGKVVFIGMGTPNALLPVSAAAFREVDMLGVFRYANRYPDALALFSSGLLPNVHKLVTTRLELKDAVKAFELLKKGVDDEGKLVLKLMVNASQ